MLPDLYQYLDIYIFCKDKNGKFISCNDKFAEVAGCDSREQIINKTDEDLVWRTQAQIFRQGDQLAMSGHPFVNVHEVMYQHNKAADILVTKHQLLNKFNHCIGVIGSFVDITGYRLLRKSGYYDKKQQRFYLGNGFVNEYLTQQEYRILKHVIMGHTSQQIANFFGLSRRTVEGHIHNLKCKMQCKSKGQIIEAAIKTGITHILDE